MPLTALTPWKSPRLWMFLLTLVVSMVLLKQSAEMPLYRNAERMQALGSVAVVESDKQAVHAATTAFDAAQVEELTTKPQLEHQAGSALVLLLIIASFPVLQLNNGLRVTPVTRLRTMVFALAALAAYPWLAGEKGFRDMQRMYYPVWEDGLHVVLSMLITAVIILAILLLPFFISLARGYSATDPVDWRAAFCGSLYLKLVSGLTGTLCLALLLATGLALARFSYIDACSAWLLALFFFYYTYSPFRYARAQDSRP